MLKVTVYPSSMVGERVGCGVVGGADGPGVNAMSDPSEGGPVGWGVVGGVGPVGAGVEEPARGHTVDMSVGHCT